MLRLRVLGSGDAFNGAGCLHSCYMLEHENGTLMLECGPSVLAAMKRHQVDPAAPDVVLISHLHGDHFAGLSFLYLEYMFRTERDRPLVIAGPAMLEERAHDLFCTLYKDVERKHEITFDVKFIELAPGDRAELAGMQVEAFQVDHSAEPYSLGYVIGAGGGRVVFSGDSAWTEEFVARSADTDLFLCECCSMAPESGLHTSYEDILAHRDELGCKRLLLTHLGADVRSSKDVDAELASDGMVVDIA